MYFISVWKYADDLKKKYRNELIWKQRQKWQKLRPLTVPYIFQNMDT